MKKFTAKFDALNLLKMLNLQIQLIDDKLKTIDLSDSELKNCREILNGLYEARDAAYILMGREAAIRLRNNNFKKPESNNLPSLFNRGLA